MTEILPWYMASPWFQMLFVAFWLFICGVLAYLGGWASLASAYRVEQAPEGERFRFVSGSLGIRYFPVSYGNCLFVTVDPKGFYLSILFPFRFMHPRLYLPLASIEEIVESRFLFIRIVRLRMKGGWPRISLRGAAAQAVRRAYLQSRGT